MTNKKRLSENRSYFVVKDNQLITKSRYSLTLQQQKILLFFISRIKPDDEPGTMYEMTIQDFCKVCGCSSDSGYYYQTIKEDIASIDKAISWIEIEPGREVRFRWLDMIEINRNTGKIRVSFHRTVENYLFQLKEQYTQYSLFNVLAMKCKYSVRVYEYLYSLKYKKDIYVDIDEFRKRVDAEIYSRYVHLQQKVIKPSLEEINRYTDIHVEYEPIKSGREYKTLHFTITRKEAIELYISNRDTHKVIDRNSSKVLYSEESDRTK